MPRRREPLAFLPPHQVPPSEDISDARVAHAIEVAESMAGIVLQHLKFRGETAGEPAPIARRAHAVLALEAAHRAWSRVAIPGEKPSALLIAAVVSAFDDPRITRAQVRREALISWDPVFVDVSTEEVKEVYEIWRNASRRRGRPRRGSISRAEVVSRLLAKAGVKLARATIERELKNY